MCPTGETIQIGVLIGQIVAIASGGILCTNSVQNWTVSANSNAPMHNGPASAAANASAYGGGVSENAQTTAEVKLHTPGSSSWRR